MDVEHRLAGVGVRIDHGAVPAVGDPFLLGDLGSENRHASNDLGIAELIQRWHVLARDDEHVRGRLRVDVAKGEAIVGFRDDLRRDLAADDPAEKTIVSHARSPR